MPTSLAGESRPWPVVAGEHSARGWSAYKEEGGGLSRSAPAQPIFPRSFAHSALAPRSTALGRFESARPLHRYPNEGTQPGRTEGTRIRGRLDQPRSARAGALGIVDGAGHYPPAECLGSTGLPTESISSSSLPTMTEPLASTTANASPAHWSRLQEAAQDAVALPTKHSVRPSKNASSISAELERRKHAAEGLIEWFARSRE